MTDRHLRIVAPQFTAAIVLRGGVVVKAAGSVGYMARCRWPEKSVRDYCQNKGWQVEEGE